MDQNPYIVLGVQEDASHEVIKRQYHTLLLQFHPDKLQSREELESRKTFLEIQAAWEILGNDAKRKVFDSKVALRHNKTESAAEVDLDDLDYDAANRAFKHSCRCSDSILVKESDLDKGLDTFECPSCSLRIRVLYEVMAE